MEIIRFGARVVPLVLLLAGLATPAVSQDIRKGPMTLDRMHELIVAVDPEAERAENGRIWQLTVAEVPVNVITDEHNDRMRAVVGIKPLAELDPAELVRAMQANFDTALDARYAIAQGVLWATYIHPLSPLTDKQFLSGLGQTANLARTFGSVYSSGGLSFGGGDSQGILRELLDELEEKGERI